jgi:penicillin-binding protein 1C
VDGQYLGTSRADERVWWTPSEGVHEIYVADSSGLSSRRRLEVRSQGR